MAALFVLFLFALVVAIHLWRSRRPQAIAQPPEPLQPMRGSFPVPQGVFVHNGHTWARLTPDGVLRVGIDSFLAEAIGNADAVELPPRGTEVKRGDPLFRVQAKGRWMQLYSPVDGEVVWTHADIESRPWAMTLDPFGVGWAVALHSKSIASLVELRTGQQAGAFLRAEVQRLVEYLSTRNKVGNQLVFADGATPPKGVAAQLDPSGWQGFCEGFVSSARSAE